MRVDVTLVLLYFVQHVLGLELCRSTLLVHYLDCLLLRFDLAIDILQLAAQPLRSLRLGLNPSLKLLVLQHLVTS